MKAIYGLLIVVGLMFGSCNEDTNTPGTGSVQLEMKATTSLSKMSSSGRRMATGLIFRQVVVGVTELEFETPEENEQEDIEDSQDGDDDGEDDNEEVEFAGPFVVDLIAGTSTPDFGVANILPGTYEELEIEIGPVLDSGNSIFVAFDIPRDGQDTLKVQYSFSGEIEIEIEREAGFQIDGGALSQMLVLLNLDSLVNGVDFSQAVVDADGVIRLNDTSNSSLADVIDSNFDTAIEGGEDEDHDDEIDED